MAILSGDFRVGWKRLITQLLGRVNENVNRRTKISTRRPVKKILPAMVGF
jgi:hypothetical protein